MDEQVVWLQNLGLKDVEHVGGKNSSLGEMIANLTASGVSVPGGFATTASAYRSFLGFDGLDERINQLLDNLVVDDIPALTAAGSLIRTWVMEHPFPPALEASIREHYQTLEATNSELAVAVRSSATAEDLPDASFAGQQETFLNVRGIDNVCSACEKSSPRSTTIVLFRIGFTKVTTIVKSPYPRVSNRWCGAILAQLV